MRRRACRASTGGITAPSPAESQAESQAAVSQMDSGFSAEQATFDTCVVGAQSTFDGAVTSARSSHSSEVGSAGTAYDQSQDLASLDVQPVGACER